MVWYEVFDFVHFIGLVWGVGFATAVAVISAKAEKNEDVAKAAMKVVPTFIKFIWAGMVLLIISGIALPYFMAWPVNKPMLIVKHVLVVWIIIFGIMLGMTSRKIRVFTPMKSSEPSKRFLKLKKQMKIFSIINLVLWYLVTLLSVFV